MRHPAQAITTDDVAALEGVTGQQLWDAISSVSPKINPAERAQIFNYLINTQKLGKPEVMTARYFFEQGLRPSKPIFLPSQNVRGVVTDVKTSAGMILFSIDGNIVIVHPMGSVYTWPLGSEFEEVVEPTIKRAKKVAEETYPSNVYNRFEGSYKGRTVRFKGKEGVLTDIAFLGPQNLYYMVIDGHMFGGQHDSDLDVLED